MRRLTEYLTVAILALALGACSTVDFHWWPVQEQTDGEPPPEAPDAPPHEIASSEIVISEVIPDPLAGVLDRANGYLAQPPETQRQEFARTEANYLGDPSDLNLIHHALLAALTRPEHPGAYQRVRSDLGVWLRQQETTDDTTGIVPLARVVLHLLDERERLMAQLTSQNEELQHKLDELKAIEQQLRERDSTEIIRTLP